MSKDNWYEINDPGQIDSPALIVYPERVRQNINTLQSIVNEPEYLRPHVKTHKTKEATLMMMEAGITKFKCATIAEAEMLGICLAKDILLAYQPNGPKLERLVTLIKQYPASQFSCLVDNQETAELIAKAGLNANIIINVYIDLNVGMNRTGIVPGNGALTLYKYCVLLKGVQVKGFHAYDGHINDPDPKKRALQCNKIISKIELMRSALIEAGYENPVIIAGGSVTLPIYSEKGNIECSPGTFIFWDKGYQEILPEQNFIPAALVITRIVSLLPDQKICVDLGHKSIASENKLAHRVNFINAPTLKAISHSEEHLVLQAPGKHSWKIGDVLYGLPFHICPTCALYENLKTVEDGVVTGTWEIIARNRKITI